MYMYVSASTTSPTLTTETVSVTLEVHLSVPVSVQNVDHSPHQRVLLQLRDAHKLLHRQRAILIHVQLLEASAQSLDLIRLNCVCVYGVCECSV